MMNNKTGIPTLTVGQTVKQLSSAYSEIIKAGKSVRLFPSVMLWGAPGVGKSQAVRQIAGEITEKTGKRVNITDVRLLLFNPVDLRGIPTSNEDRTLAVWLKPEIFQMDEGDDVINILFLDEISAAPPSVQAAAYQITLDRKVGEHRLPENCIIIAAGNRVTDRSVAYNMPKALSNRLCHIEIISDSRSWHKWATENGINKAVVGFIDHNPSLLIKADVPGDALAFPTPRSWEMVSSILNNISEEVSEMFPLITGLVGEEAANEFKVWSEVFSRIPDVRDIFSGDSPGVPLRPEGLFALSAEIISYAKDHHSEKEIMNAVKYVSKMPVEFKNRVFSDLLHIKGIFGILSDIPEYDIWFSGTRRDWDAYIL